jgi:hypothetical protein
MVLLQLESVGAIVPLEAGRKMGKGRHNHWPGHMAKRKDYSYTKFDIVAGFERSAVVGFPGAFWRSTPVDHLRWSHTGRPLRTACFAFLRAFLTLSKTLGFLAGPRTLFSMLLLGIAVQFPSQHICLIRKDMSMREPT